MSEINFIAEEAPAGGMTVRTSNITIPSHTPQQDPPVNQFVPTQPRPEATPKNLCQACRCPFPPNALFPLIPQLKKGSPPSCPKVSIGHPSLISVAFPLLPFSTTNP